MFTKDQASKIHKEILDAVDAICAKNGLLRTKSSLRYGELLELRVEVQVRGGKTKEQTTYERYQRMLGLPALGTKFTDAGVTYETAGLRVGGPYKSLIFRDLRNGKLYRQDVFKLQQRVAALRTIKF